jgi:glycosyltransferase involved in cell wall biosynthesis
MEDFSQQRNYAFEKTLGDWIFFVDADEVVSTELAKEITEIITKNKVFDGFSLKRDDIFLGKTLRFGETAHINFCRLVKKGKGVWQGLVHERLEVRGKTGVLKNRLLHYSHANLTEFLEKINSYSTYRAMELKAKGEKTSFFDILWHFNAKFILNYFIRFGFLDGFLGLVMALMMSFHSFLVRSKLYLLTRNK